MGDPPRHIKDFFCHFLGQPHRVLLYLLPPSSPQTDRMQRAFSIIASRNDQIWLSPSFTLCFIAFLDVFKTKKWLPKIRNPAPTPNLGIIPETNFRPWKWSRKKNGLFTARMTVRVSPPPHLTVSSSWLWPWIMIVCVLKRILHTKKVIFIQLQESSIPPTAAAALSHKKGIWVAFSRPPTIR